jgi:hypothetical protein
VTTCVFQVLLPSSVRDWLSMLDGEALFGVASGLPEGFIKCAVAALVFAALFALFRPGAFGRMTEGGPS